MPGSAQERTSTFFEWVCPDCDYFEEIEEGAGPRALGEGVALIVAQAGQGLRMRLSLPD